MVTLRSLVSCVFFFSLYLVSGTGPGSRFPLLHGAMEDIHSYLYVTYCIWVWIDGRMGRKANGRMNRNKTMDGGVLQVLQWETMDQTSSLLDEAIIHCTYQDVSRGW